MQQKEVLPKKTIFLGLSQFFNWQNSFGCTFYQDKIYIFEISKKDGFFGTPFAIFEEKSFHSSQIFIALSKFYATLRNYDFFSSKSLAPTVHTSLLKKGWNRKNTELEFLKVPSGQIGSA